MKMRSWMAWLGLPVVILVVAACAVLTGAKQQVEQVKYRLSPSQVKAIIEAGPEAKVTGWVDSTLWIQVNGGTPQDEAHPCPPFDDC